MIMKIGDENTLATHLEFAKFYGSQYPSLLSHMFKQMLMFSRKFGRENFDKSVQNFSSAKFLGIQYVTQYVCSNGHH